MNSISYLDSVLSRSFASDKNIKRSRSYSSIPGSSQGRRRSSSSSGPPPSSRSSSPHRRTRAAEADIRSSSNSSYPYPAKLRRTGSTPAGVSTSHRYYRHDDGDGTSDQGEGNDDAADADGLPRARWSALWGLTGWLDDAINPSGTTPPPRSRKTSSTKSSGSRGRIDEAQGPPPDGLRRSRRVPSLDSLLMASSAPVRRSPRRTASSGTAAQVPIVRAKQPSAPVDEESRPRRRSSNGRKSRFGHAACLTMTGVAAPDPAEVALRSEDAEQLDERDMMSEREREDIVDFDGGDFAPDDLDAVGAVSGSPRRYGPSQHLRQESGDSQSGASSAGSTESGDPFVGQGLLDQTASGARLPPPAPDIPEMGIPVSHQAASSSSAPPPPCDAEKASMLSIFQKASRHVSQQAAAQDSDGLASGQSSSSPQPVSPPPSTSSMRQDNEAPTDGLSNMRRRPSRKAHGRQDSNEMAQPTSDGWLKARPPYPHSASSIPASSPFAPRRWRFSPSRAFRRALIALRDILIVILSTPLRGMQLLAGRPRRARYIREADLKGDIMAQPEREAVAVLLREKRLGDGDDAASFASSDASEIASKKGDAELDDKMGRPRSLSSLRFAAADGNVHKLPRSNSGRPRTPRPEIAPSELFPAEATPGHAEDRASPADTDARSGKDSDDEEPVTEEQAAARAEKQRLARLAAGGRAEESGHPQRPPLVPTRSRLLPNPHPIDPMLAHDRKAQPVDEAMAREEARLQAERKAKVDERRAARRTAQLNPAAAKAALEAAPAAAAAAGGTHAMAKVPRGPSSSIIHHTPKILVLDLDETLIHSTSRSPTTYYNGAGRRVSTGGGGILGLESLGAVLGLRANENPGRIRPHMVEVVLDGRSVLYHVYKRPWVDYFLRKVASWYHVVIFTASVQEYADPVIDWLDQGRGLIGGRLFREACTYKNGSYVKNLQVVDPDLSAVCLVDNSPASYAHNQANGIPIEGWTHDPNDEALLDLLPVLDSLRFATDVRHILGIRGFSSS